MKDVSANANAKKAAGVAAADLVRSGMVVGLGTGSTVAWTIKRLGEKVKEEGLDFYGVPTSFQAEDLAIASGIKLTTLNQHPLLDLAIDGRRHHEILTRWTNRAAWDWGEEPISQH